jgi:hypothetical protein
MFGWLSPVGIVPGVSQALGTIVIFNGEDGTKPGNFGYASQYFNAGYEVVEVAFEYPWMQTYESFGGNNPPYGNIQNAACRPATFLNYVYTVLFPNVQNQLSTAGMCAHGDSAGSAAIAYSLAYYGAGSWLDNVELISGPVFSDVKQGCEVTSPPPPQVTICGLMNCNHNTSQCGCQLGGGSDWTLSPTYIQNVEYMVSAWTNYTNPGCANTSGTLTTQTENQAWLAMSVVDQAGTTGMGATPTFNYPGTGMSAWLCRPPSASGSPNNSSPQGQLFYAQIPPNNLPPNYAIYAVDLCKGPEMVEYGNVPGYQPAVFGGTVTGAVAVAADMVGYKNNGGVQVIAPQCFRRAH